MDWITSPEVNAQVAEYFGEAPGADQGVRVHQPTRTSATSTTPPTTKFAAQIHYWTTPQKQCVDGSGDNCTAYDEWVDKWQQIKG